MKTFISILYRVRNLTEKMGYGQGHMQMGMAEKKGLLKFQFTTDLVTKVKTW